MYKTLFRAENSFLYIFILLLEGYLTLSIEILSIRQLIPFVGNSVITTSLIIGFFLLALALGYQKGGSYRDNFNSILAKNFLIAFYIFGIGLSYVFLDIIFYYLRDALGFNQFFVLTIYLLLITCPLVYLLGQTVPLIMGLLHNISHTAAVSGFVLNISTVGSFLGAILTSLVLFNYLGVAGTIFINLLLLSILVLLFYLDKFAAIIFLSLSLVFMYILNISIERQYFIRANGYANYHFSDENNIETGELEKKFYINQSSSSLITNNGRSFEYIEYIKKILFKDLKLKNKNIVVLGAGGFTLSANGDYGNHFTYVDIDTEISKIVLDNNFINKVHGEFVGLDARDYINRYKNFFDVVISDAYTNRMTIPFHLLTKEYFISIKQSLKPEGLAIFNIIGSPFFKDKYTKLVDNTIRRVFNNCSIVPLSSKQNTNIVYMCNNNNTVDSVYTDDLNTAPLDSIS